MSKALQFLLLVSVPMLLGLATPLCAEPAEISVRVISKDAKFIGTSMGGVLITIRDAETGELLARGRTEGGTGDTDHMMKNERKRGVALSSAGSAKFSATIDIDEPRLVEVTAYGPMTQRQSANRVSATQWVVPGKHVTGGDGWLLVMPGFVVDVLAPPTHIKLQGVPQTIDIEANVTMMCGCPIEPGGVWDSDRYEVKALLKRNGQASGEFSLDYAGATSQFAGTLSIEEPGIYEAIVYAYDPANGNTGLDKVTFIVSE